MSKKVDNPKHSRLYLRKYQTMELVELDDDSPSLEDNDGEVVVGRKKVRKIRRGEKTFSVTEKATGQMSFGWTAQKIRTLTRSLKKEEAGRFLIEEEGENDLYTLTDNTTGETSTDWSRLKLQTFLRTLKPKAVKNYRIIRQQPVDGISYEIIKKEKEVNPQDHRKGSYAETEQEKQKSSPNSIAVLPTLSPELDTVRVYFDCRSLIYLDLFIPFTATKKVYLATKGMTGYIEKEYTNYRTEMKCSWYGKMQITREERKYGKNGKNSYPVLCFEYSVAKWYNFTNGINSGYEPTAELLLYPCIQAMKALNVERFSYDNVSFDYIAKTFLETAELRRFDLSLNFRAPDQHKSSEYVQVLSRCRVNRQKAHPYEEGSVAWGKEKSPYRVIVYDKEKEQHDYYNRKEPGGRCTYFEDAEGNTYERQNEELTLKERTIDHNIEKKDFYEQNKDKFKNIFRFEVQYRTKFMQENNLMTTGVDNIDKVIRLGVVYWRDLLNRMDEQLGRENFNTTEEKDGFAHVLDRLTAMKSSATISRTVYNNMFCFLMQCAYGEWESVRDEMGKDLFSRKYRWVKENLNYDIKVAQPKESSIMRIMPTVYLQHNSSVMRNFRLVPAPVYRPAI